MLLKSNSCSFLSFVAVNSSPLVVREKNWSDLFSSSVLFSRSFKESRIHVPLPNSVCLIVYTVVVVGGGGAVG